MPHRGEAAKRARLERIVSALKLAFAAEWQERWFGLMPRHLSPRGGVSGPRYAGARARLEQGSSLALAEEKLFAEIYFFCALTPELSRSALRPRRCDNLPNNSAAAKRSRLERIVRPLATISALRTQMQRWQLPRARQQSSTRTFPSGCHPILRVHPGSPRIQPGSWSFHPRHK